ncbi:ABC transporter ATP-binding protein [Sulfurisphaera tokodaii]|uniref:ABC transporter ATP-binding protein n=2 Tax=Sulfurisphaera tokodaii TaxID=111955 RepID=F9VN56_SULTO|nr:ABC transporter ATP-binding protein [Sulfurisphaera tokodaii]BAK54353.1 putative ABC transporter ATP-binding protein [Sulfurisphaera tokodaii str. 7]HII74691.1 ABC transporter ATP-binding protein [Sulfurisphaera tokodaii]
MHIIEVEDLWKIYKNGIEALRGISFTVDEGEIFSFLGPNGAGKTTTIKILSCVLKPSKGKVVVNGFSSPKECEKIRKIVTTVPQEFQGFSDLTVRENIEYFAKLYDTTDKVDEIIQKLNLKEHERKRFKELSGGLKRKVAIACGLVGNPKVIFLDEPTVGLDPKSRRNLWELIKSLKDMKITIFLATHYLEEAERLADRVGVLYKGRIVRISTPSELMNEFKKENLEEAYLALMEEMKSEEE